VTTKVVFFWDLAVKTEAAVLALTLVLYGCTSQKTVFVDEEEE